MPKERNEDEIRHEGAKTHYREHKDDVSGGRDKSVQSEALGAEGASNLSNSGSSSGGAAGRIEELDANPAPVRESADEKNPKPGNRGGLTR
jgi:hypothetical protein